MRLGNRFLQQVRWSSQQTQPVKKTALYDVHVKLGGKMVPFAGYQLPVQYGESVIESHLHTRKQASLFDVSHMGQLKLKGNHRRQFLQSLVPTDLLNLQDYQCKLSVLTNANGGIIDDCMITQKPDHLFVVVNAGCKMKDIAHLQQQLKEFNDRHHADVSLQYLERSLVALQGPKAAEILGESVKQLKGPVDNLKTLPFMTTCEAQLKDGISVWITRCGYTGEDGFEISVLNEASKKLFEGLLQNNVVLPAGLGVRDSLRLEAGLCLYGHDLDETITPVEADLLWLIPKKRRESGGFLGFEKIAQQIKQGPPKKRIGLHVEQGPPAREGAEILDSAGKEIGKVTSGTFSPCLKQNISMGYIETSFSKVGTAVQVQTRGKKYPAKVTKMPFVETKYYKPS